MQYPMMALRGLVIFPGRTLRFDIGREKSIKALEEAMLNDRTFFLVSQKDDRINLPTPEDIYKTGVIVRVKRMNKTGTGDVRVVVEGLTKATIKEYISENPYFICDVEEVIDGQQPYELGEEDAWKRLTIEAFDELIAVEERKQFLGQYIEELLEIEELDQMAYYIASKLNMSVEEKQEILEEENNVEKIKKVYEYLKKEIQILALKAQIKSKVNNQLETNQKEYYLREQMKAIQQELGLDEDIEDEIAQWQLKMEKLELAPEICEKLEKEIKRFSQMQPSSAEAGVARTYIETILSLPWNILSDENINLKKAEKILNEDHYGLDKVKERVLEYLAVVELSKGLKGPIICLVGPPGTGKTSIAKSIAKATNREFVRMSLGGVRDEAEIRGHRRTYIGAIPGRIINSIKDVGTRNPLFLLDEVDKLGADYKGDPSSALLEVLDPEQNKTFTDHYLEVPFDLSKVMFLTTANSLDTIPGPLLDRMEVIEVTGYTEEEKVEIAKKYLIPKKTAEHGLEKEQFAMTEKAIRDLINYYTRESGVRNLEREIASLVRKVARMVVTDGIESYKVKPANLEELLGKKKYRYDVIEGESEVGVVTGLAWTVVGGDTLFIETSAVPGTGKIQLTGQLGDVMQESAKTGISYIRSVAQEHGIDEEFYKNKDIHIHVPEGAVPKDGPSAGVTMSVAMISTLTGTPVRKDVAMTGEVTLTGKVLPVGGIREKVLAAHRAGIKKVLLPYDNERDIDEIPEKVRKQLEFVLIKNVDQALKEALVK